MKEKYIIALALFSAILILLFSDYGRSTTKIYDCGMAEWHPDIPKQVREECRKLRKELEKNFNEDRA